MSLINLLCLFMIGITFVIGVAKVDADVKGRGRAPSWKEVEDALGGRHATFSGARVIAASVAACTGRAMIPAAHPARIASILITHADIDGVMTLLACGVENGLFGELLTLPIARSFVFEAAARKSTRLLVATLGEGSVAVAALLHTQMARKGVGAAPAWTPLHAAVSNNLHALTMAKDALRERLPGAQGESVDTFSDSMKRLATALARHSEEKEPLVAAIDAFSLKNSSQTVDWPVSDDGSVIGSGEGGGGGVGVTTPTAALNHPLAFALTRTMALRHPHAIADALSAQLAQVILSYSARVSSLVAESPVSIHRAGIAAVASASTASATDDTPVGRARVAWSTAAPPAALALALDSLGRTALHIAASVGNTAALSLLLRAVSSAASAEWELGAALRLHHGGAGVGAGVGVGVGVGVTAPLGGVKALSASSRDAGINAAHAAATLPDNVGISPLFSACSRWSWDTAGVLLQIPPTTSTTRNDEIIASCQEVAKGKGKGKGKGENEDEDGNAASGQEETTAVARGWGGGGSLESAASSSSSSSPSPSSSRVNAALAVVALDTEECNIDTLDATTLTPVVFMQRYLAASQPVRVRGLRGEHGFMLARLFDREALVARAGNVGVSVSKIPNASKGAGADADTSNANVPRNMSLSDFIAVLENGEGGYVSQSFDSATSTLAVFKGISPRKLLPRFLRQARLPLRRGVAAVACIDVACLLRIEGNIARGEEVGVGWGGALREGGDNGGFDFTPLIATEPPMRPKFFLGATGAGAPYQVHTDDALNELTAGRKRWWLEPPSRACYSTVPVIEWILKGEDDVVAATTTSSSSPSPSYSSCTPAAARYRCTQQAGEAIFVPAGWAHALLYLETSIGVDLEFPAVTTAGY